VEFRILGPLEVRDGDREMVLRGGKQRALLALLLVNANRTLAIDRIVDELWGENVPESAQKMVQIYVSQLRKVLPPGTVHTRPPGYALVLAPDELDLDRFERLVAEARASLDAGRAEEASADFRAALELWRGPALAEFASEPFAPTDGARLEELRVHALEGRLEADLALGRHADLVGELEALVARYPLREELRRQHMLALYRSGRQAEALAAYQEARRALSGELGIEPSPALRDLERKILQQDSSLDLAALTRKERGGDLHDVDRAVSSQDPRLDAPVAAELPPGRPPRGEERKTVTVLAVDVTPDDLPDDPEARRSALRERSADAERVLQAHGATVLSLGSGRLLGVFGAPAAHDDDALQSARAGVALRSVGRIGMATGEVVTGDPLVSGSPVDEAASLRDRATTGEVLACHRTWRLLQHAATGSPRDGSWAIEAVDPQAAPLLRRLETPIVGRERELEQIVEAFERAAAESRPHLVTVFGSPGIGKTRLAVECIERLGAVATSAVGRCRAGDEEVTYAPLRDVLAALASGDVADWIRARLGTDDDGAQLAERLIGTVGLGAEPGRTEDTALAARRLLAGLARDRPVLLVLEDVHWAASAFLDLVEVVVEIVRAPVLVLCLARPDLLDVRPHWGGGRLSSSSILLDALTQTESEELLDRLSFNGQLDAAGRERILAVAEGNPLFIEQLLAASLEGQTNALPDSIQTLLAARLDRLDESDREVAQAAAVCGTSFSEGDVATLVDDDPAMSLLTLARRELISPGEPGDDGGAGWSFRHSLIRDVAYGSLPKWRRAELHERLAERAMERGNDGDVSAGVHLYRAVYARREAGEHGVAVDRLAGRAAEHLRRAGLAAFESDDLAAAASLLERANELLPRESPERVELLPKLGNALAWIGDRPAALVLLAEARDVAAELGDARLLARATLASDLTTLFSEDAVAPERLLRDVEEAAPVLERAGDFEGLAMAELLRFNALDRARLESPEERLPIALAYARKAGARQIEHQVLSWICITLPRGTTPVDDAIARVREIASASISTYTRASALGALGLLQAMQGDFAAARELVEEDRRMLEQLGLPHSEAAHSIAVAEVEMMAGEDAAAERILRAGYEGVAAFGDRHGATNAAWRLGLVLARQGKDDEAERFAQVAAHAQPAGLWVDVWWRVVLALVEAHRGAGARARQLVEDARTQMASVGESGMHADALLEAADALAAAGLEDEAAALVAEAAGIAERLGYVVASRRAEEAQRALTA
jgi:DNA-binding SARP family transcriptional activator